MNDMDGCAQSREYCAFCSTGKEELTAQIIQRIMPVVALTPKLLCCEKHKEQWVEHTRALLPGYLFLYADADTQLDFRLLYSLSDVYRVLTYEDQSSALRGADSEFARWIRAEGGIIGKSNALREGDRIHVVDGPLKLFEGAIKKVNKQRKRALVEVNFHGICNHVWMPFEWVKAQDEEILIKQDMRDEKR